MSSSAHHRGHGHPHYSTAYDPLAGPAVGQTTTHAHDWASMFFLLCLLLFSVFSLLSVRLAVLGVFSALRAGVARLATAMGIVKRDTR